MFWESKFNGDISQWNVSNVDDMDRMFMDSEFNGHLSKWNVSKVTSYSNVFGGKEYTNNSWMELIIRLNCQNKSF